MLVKGRDTTANLNSKWKSVGHIVFWICLIHWHHGLRYICIYFHSHSFLFQFWLVFHSCKLKVWNIWCMNILRTVQKDNYLSFFAFKYPNRCELVIFCSIFCLYCILTQTRLSAFTAHILDQAINLPNVGFLSSSTLLRPAIHFAAVLLEISQLRE